MTLDKLNGLHDKVPSHECGNGTAREEERAMG